MLESFPNRKSTPYLQRVEKLFSIDYLTETAKPLDENDREDKEFIDRGFKAKATIYFSGLAGLTLFGSEGRPRVDELGAKSLEKILRGDVKKLNDAFIVLQIKILFAYPYSNFMYDMLDLEVNGHRYLSIEDVKGLEKYEYSFRTESKLTMQKIRDSRTYHRLTNSLNNIQTAVDLNQGLWNVPKWNTDKFCPNNIIVKFCPINMLCCTMRVNNVILSDVYVYAKTDENSKEMALLTPINCLEIPIYSEETEKDKEAIDQFCSFLSHFKYLWEHPLTMYSMDATKYRRGEKNLHEILTPLNVSYDKKAKRILRKMKSTNHLEVKNQARADNWKQFIKNEFLNNCSKILANNDFQVEKKEILPLRLFIIGAWKNGQANKFMRDIEAWINANLAKENVKGLQFKCKILQIKNGEAFTPELYNSLNSSNLGIVIQTVDLGTSKTSKFSKPNVYLEKGYLMGKLRTLKTKDEGKQCQTVFVFKEVGVPVETDNVGFGYTEFDESTFTSKLHELVFWLWNITQLNSEYALELMNVTKPTLETELHGFKDNCQRIKEYIEKQ